MAPALKKNNRFSYTKQLPADQIEKIRLFLLLYYFQALAPIPVFLFSLPKKCSIKKQKPFSFRQEGAPDHDTSPPGPEEMLCS
jgi:hypothetical protein